MTCAARRAQPDDIAAWREAYRREMACQIIHDSIHQRPGWTQEYALSIERTPVGYGSVAVGGPWQGTPTLYEFYVEPSHRVRVFSLFEALLETAGPTHIEVQSNDPLAAAMLHTYARSVIGESILFHDQVTTTLAPPGAGFRAPAAGEIPDLVAEQVPWHGVVDVGGVAAATGGILFHYNRPYGDIYMNVAEPHRRRGLGAFLVQELKRVCYAGGHVPAARCNPGNLASRLTLQKAGFVPCGHVLKGVVQPGATGT